MNYAVPKTFQQTIIFIKSCGFAYCQLCDNLVTTGLYQSCQDNLVTSRYSPSSLLKLKLTTYDNQQEHNLFTVCRSTCYKLWNCKETVLQQKTSCNLRVSGWLTESLIHLSETFKTFLIIYSYCPVNFLPLSCLYIHGQPSTVQGLGLSGLAS